MKKMKLFTRVLMAMFLVLSCVFCITKVDAKVTPDGSLTGLKLEDSAHWMDDSWRFIPGQYEYDLDAWLETYGVRFTPTVAGGGSVEVTMSGTQLEETTQTVQSGEQFILNLTQNRESSNAAGTGTRGIEDDCTYMVQIKTSTDEVYTLHITRPGLQQYVDQFERKTLDMSEIEGAEEGKTMTYWEYVPENYNPHKKYPVVLYLHGIGQRAVEATDVLLRNAAATTFAYYGKEVIVIAPQCNYSDLSATDVWADGDMKLSVFGEGAYQIVQNAKATYNIDSQREYVVGLSMGGQGTCGMIASYPDEWAGALINAAPYAATEEGLKKLVSAVDQIPCWFAYATNDESVNYGISHDVLMPALDEAGVSYKCTVVTDDEYLAPMRHFVWAIQWANEDVLDWLLSQKKTTPSITLDDLEMEDPAQLTSLNFNKNKTTYNLTVFEDVYGLRFTPSISGGGTIKVTTCGSGIDTKTVEVANGEKFELNLSQTRECTGGARSMEDDCTYKVIIRTSDKTYTINVKRPGTDALVAKFKRCTWTMSNGREMTYWLYVPENYDPSKKYPVVITPHGGGQFAVDAEDILVRTAQTTAFAKYGMDCIVIAPHGNYTELDYTDASFSRAWATDDLTPSPFLTETMNILEDVKKNYSVDTDRISAAGASQGGRAVVSLVVNYPDTFAAAVVDAPAFTTLTGTTDPQVTDTIKASAAKFASVVKENNNKVWFVHATSDPTVNIKATEVLMDAMDTAGVKYNSTIYPAGTYFSPTDHFAWVPFFDHEENLSWLIKQKKEAAASDDQKDTGKDTGKDTQKKITVSKTKIKTLKAGKKSFKVTYKKVSGAKYQIAYRKKGTTKWKYVKRSGNICTIKKLAAKKYYYVKVRAYKTVNGKTYYSAWTASKKVKTKK